MTKPQGGMLGRRCVFCEEIRPSDRRSFCRQSRLNRLNQSISRSLADVSSVQQAHVRWAEQRPTS
ncbi:hypothetical protein KIN20_031605 [Parelaphostrongylus tenuis]|uniref:Uncharacterized protein n=1 Tax=Parelaphostrongylus tenuis TaxID=148309 RepID=A0AAD5WHD6_PARTN|nr:hypothetical protein KIN20_031605 [Parelaphostrongylus tenuis]